MSFKVVCDSCDMPFYAAAKRVRLCPPCQESHPEWIKRMEKARKYQAKYHAKRKAFIAEIKLRAGCADCGYNAHPEALDFDHVRGKKSFAMASRRSIKRKFEEAMKCEIVCSNCHRIRTWRRRQEAKQGETYGHQSQDRDSR